VTTPVLILIGHPSSDFPAPDELRIVPHDEPAIEAMNIGLTRGDGVFESVGIHRGRAHAVDAHLDRFAHSARLLELPAPNLHAYRAAVELGIEALGTVEDAYCKYVLTRGIEGRESAPTGFAFFDVNPDWTRERTRGIGVVTLTRGYPLDIAQTAPWLLQGAKTLSYAINRAVIREAVRRDAEDVLFTTTDGFLLEGPTASALLRFGDRFVTPRTDHGVLHGTAQIGAFEYLRSQGFAVEYRDVRVEELASADGIWLTNSQRLAAPVRMLDGRPLEIDAPFTAALNAALLGRME
jgi:4-amino-4-deoxychorismate lyase